MEADIKTYQVSFGGTAYPIRIPRSNIAAELTMTELPPVVDVHRAVIDALEHPIGSPPLSERLKAGNKVALLVGDRITDRLLGSGQGVGMTLLNHLNRLGIRDSDVMLVYAGGAHANPDWQERLGKELLARIHCVKHDPRDEKNLTFIGVTSRSTPVWINTDVARADFILGIGEISPTVQGGFTGGGKIILPGVAGMDTIQQNHHFIMVPKNTLGLVDSNHMRLDMEESARLASLHMKLDIVVNSKAEAVGVYAGDFVAEHRAAMPTARRIWMTKMDPVDIFVVYPGERGEEYLSSALWIRLEGADAGLKEGGITILVLSARGGWASRAAIEGDMVGAPEMLKTSSEELTKLMVRKIGNIRSASMLYSSRRMLEKRRTFLVCEGIDPEEASQFGFAYCTRSFDEARAKALSERGRDARIAVNLQSTIGWRTMPWREG